MSHLSRLFAAFGLAAASFVLLASAGLAAPGHGSSHARGAPASQAAAPASGCDVRGAACDPSKTDTDNGVGNNCDPGYGRGNQAKFAPDEATTSCRTSTSSAAAETGTSAAQLTVTLNKKNREVTLNGESLAALERISGATVTRHGNELTITLPAGVTIVVNGMVVTTGAGGEVLVNGAPLTGTVSTGGVRLSGSAGTVNVTGAGTSGTSAVGSSGASLGSGGSAAATTSGGESAAVAALAETGTPIVSGLLGGLLLLLGGLLLWRRTRQTA